MRSFTVLDTLTGETLTAGEAVRRFSIDTPDYWVDPESARWVMFSDGGLAILWGEGVEKEVLELPDGAVFVQGESKPLAPPAPACPTPTITLQPGASFEASLDMVPVLGTLMKREARRAYFASYLPLCDRGIPLAVEGSPVIELRPENWEDTPSMSRLRIKFTTPTEIKGIVGLFVVDENNQPLAWLTETHSFSASGVIDRALIAMRLT